jgi:hypothetical protein
MNTKHTQKPPAVNQQFYLNDDCFLCSRSSDFVAGVSKCELGARLIMVPSSSTQAIRWIWREEHEQVLPQIQSSESIPHRQDRERNNKTSSSSSFSSSSTSSSPPPPPPQQRSETKDRSESDQSSSEFPVALSDALNAPNYYAALSLSKDEPLDDIKVYIPLCSVYFVV